MFSSSLRLSQAGFSDVKKYYINMDLHIPFMRRCIELAANGRGKVGNGALVGSVLVRDNKIIAEGWHDGFGKPHAERMLLENFTGLIELDDILYVNLEPCCHHGKTPPCTDIILERGVKTVVYGLSDPDVRVRGQGLGLLKEKGVNVIGPMLPEQCARLNRGFLSVRTKNRPFITLKKAQTVDGRIAHDDGSPMSITSDNQNKWSHKNLRAKHDAILVGIGTVLCDNPSLTIRYIDNPPKLWRIILDAKLRIPLDCKVVTSPLADGTIIITTPQSIASESAKHQQLIDRGVKVWPIAMINDSFDMQALFDQLLKPDGDYKGVTSILVEGGRKTWEKFKDQGFVDEEVVLMG